MTPTDAPEPTPAVERATRAMSDASERGSARDMARAALAAALPTECHESVQGWTEDEERPCNQAAVAFREDKWEGGGPPYPVCSKHATPDLVPLTTAILGGAQ